MSRKRKAVDFERPGVVFGKSLPVTEIKEGRRYDDSFGYEIVTAGDTHSGRGIRSITFLATIGTHHIGDLINVEADGNHLPAEFAASSGETVG